MLTSQAVTYGPLLSDPLQIAIDERKGFGSTPTVALIAGLISEAKADGVNVDKWLRGQLLQITMGAAAEAKYTGTSIEAIWRGDACASDRADAVRACVTYAGLPPEQAETRIVEALARANSLADNVNVYRAVRLLADKLPTSGSMSGPRAAEILLEALAA